MPTFYDSQGNSYDLSQEIGRGGEGAVFYCPNDSLLVAKIYHEPIDLEKEEKLRWMAANSDDRLQKVAAWIVDTLHDRAGNIVGFLMPNVRAKEIHELYSLKSRRVHFPEATWQFLLHTAANVARAFYVLHKNDHIMGDVNHGNCVVLADGTVKLIDCDSYSIKTDKMRYRCEVGVATHLAPELQGIDLGEVEREKKHDNFGLAVIIFQLLFLGRHPFAGNYLGTEDKSLEDCIREHRFAYWNEDVTRVKQPPGTLSLSQISKRVADLFKLAFFSLKRPEAKEWIEALEDLSDSLRQCPVHIGHHYFNGLVVCPWCDIESKTGLLLFPFISGKEFANEFNIFTVEQLLANLEIPQNLPARPLIAWSFPPPSAEAVQVYQQSRNTFIGLGLIEIWLVIVISFISPGCGFVFGMVIMALFLAVRHSFVNDGIGRLKKELYDARAGWEYFENEWRNYKNDQDFTLDIEKVRHKVNDYQSLQQEKQTQTKQLTDAAFQYQLTIYLQSFIPAEAKIWGIEDEQLKTFKRFGLKTAADINEWRLNSFGFDDKTKDLLLRWRRKLESEFEFDPNTQLPEVTKNGFEIEFANKRRKIEKEIEQMLVTLRSVSAKLRHQQHQLTAKSQKLAQTLVQAESNFAKVNDTVLMTLVLVLIPIFVPIAASVIQTASSSNPVDMSMVNRPANRVVARPVDSSSPIYADPNFKVNENITDKQLAEMSAFEREKSAHVLQLEALKLIEAKDYKNAEKKLRLAVKFVDYDKTILYALGEVLYNQKKYSESIKFLDKVLFIDSQNEEANILIGANYLKMQKYDKAEAVFLTAQSRNPDSYEANFNLGIVYKNLDDYESAQYKFGKAVQIRPDDIEANFEYGVTLYKTGRKVEAQKQYDILFKLDEAKAEKLRRIIDGEPAKTPKPPSFVIGDAEPTP